MAAVSFELNKSYYSILESKKKECAPFIWAPSFIKLRIIGRFNFESKTLGYRC